MEIEFTSSFLVDNNINDSESELDTDFDIPLDCLLLMYLVSLNILNSFKNYVKYIWNSLFVLIKTLQKNIYIFNKEFIETVNSSNGLRVCFISLFVATILTLYEVILFYVFVIPSIDKEINNSIILISQQVKQQFKFTFSIDTQIIIEILYNMNMTLPIDNLNNNLDIKLFTDILLDNYYSMIVDVSNTKLQNLIKYIFNNNNTKLFILGILKTLSIRESILVNEVNIYTIVTVCILLFFLVICLFSIKQTLSNRNEVLGGIVWVSSILTIILILMFQYSFYVYANKYKYIGTTDTDELVNFIINQL